MKALIFATVSPLTSRLPGLQGGETPNEVRTKPMAGGTLILASAALASAALIFDPANDLAIDSANPPVSLFANIGAAPAPQQPGPNPPPG